MLWIFLAPLAVSVSTWSAPPTAPLGENSGSAQKQNLPPVRAPTEDQTAPAAKAVERDETPSDAAALGFLAGVADQRMYSLTKVGARSISVGAIATLQPATGPVQRYEYDLARDLYSGEGVVLCDGQPLTWERPEAMKITFPLMACATTQPSLVAEDYVVRLRREGKEVRLDYSPRVANMGARLSEWFQRDGSKLRGLRFHKENEDTPEQESSVEYELKEVGGYAVISKETQTIGTATLTTDFEYWERDGYLVLQRLVQRTPTEVLTIDYSIQVTPPRR